MADEENVPLEDRSLKPIDVRKMQGAWLFDQEGEVIGRIGDVLVTAEKKPEWMMVSFGPFLHQDRLVPVFDITRQEPGYVVSYTKQKVHDAPSVSVIDMSDADEKKLMDYWCVGGKTAESPRACKYF